MDQKAVRKLEKVIEKAVADVVCRLGLRELPVLPSQDTIHLMAKAAAAIYKRAAEGHEEAN